MLHLRDANKNDTDSIVTYIKELAEYEHLAHECFASYELIEKWLFSEKPKAYCIMAEWEGKPAGFALYFYNFSTFLTKPGIYIEDIYVRPDFRRKGIAKAMFKHLARKAIAEDCGRIEWWVLDWNKDAITFYQSIGAISMDEWTVQRITGEALKNLAI